MVLDCLSVSRRRQNISTKWQESTRFLEKAKIMSKIIRDIWENLEAFPYPATIKKVKCEDATGRHVQAMPRVSVQNDRDPE